DDEDRPRRLAEVTDRSGDRLLLAHGAGDPEAAAGGDGGEIDAARGVRLLVPGLAVALVVEDGDREVPRAGGGDRGEGAHPHQHLAVAGDDEDAALRLRLGEAEPDHRREPHPAPEREGERMVAGRGAVPGRGAEPRDDEEVAAIGEKAPHDVASMHHFRKLFVPTRRCAISTATATREPRAGFAAASTVGPASSARSTRWTAQPARRSASGPV